MIWNDDAVIDRSRKGFARAITENLVDELCLDPEDITAVEAVTTSLAHFCSDRFLSLSIPDELLSFLLARGLWSAGEKELAHRIADHSCQPHISKICHNSRLTAGNAVVLWRLFQSGALKQSFWISYDHELWMLDLQRIAVDQDSRLEVCSFKGLKAILESILQIWDVESLDAILQIKGIASYAGAFLCLPLNSEPVRKLVAELKDYAQDVTKQMANATGQYVPNIRFS